MGCYIWYREEGPGRAVLLYDGPLLCGFNVAIKGLRAGEVPYVSLPAAIVNSAIVSC